MPAFSRLRSPQNGEGRIRYRAQGLLLRQPKQLAQVRYIVRRPREKPIVSAAARAGRKSVEEMEITRRGGNKGYIAAV